MLRTRNLCRKYTMCELGLLIPLLSGIVTYSYAMFIWQVCFETFIYGRWLNILQEMYGNMVLTWELSCVLLSVSPGKESMQGASISMHPEVDCILWWPAREVLPVWLAATITWFCWARSLHLAATYLMGLWWEGEWAEENEGRRRVGREPDTKAKCKLD